MEFSTIRHGLEAAVAGNASFELADPFDDVIVSDRCRFVGYETVVPLEQHMSFCVVAVVYVPYLTSVLLPPCVVGEGEQPIPGRCVPSD